MRFFIYCESDEPTVEPFILAEVVRDEASDRAMSLAAALAGPRSKILTRTELVCALDGRRALERWEARDDSMFETETALLHRTGRTGNVRLHIVGEEPEPPRAIPARLPADEELRRAVLISRGLREMTRHAIQRARELREELNERRRDQRGTDELVG
jgi:hypothetical protein